MRRPLAWLRRLVALFAERLVEVELFDRSVALASQAFVALIPFMVVAAALTPYGERSALSYMPQSIAASSERFGAIGIAIAIVSWLIGMGFVLVVGAAFGAVIAGRRPLEREPQQSEG
jgi:uncharacterized BrkB/YihY/UPF0761 family membrane protein